MSKKEILALNLPADLIAALKAEAKKEERSTSNMATILIREALNKKAA